MNIQDYIQQYLNWGFNVLPVNQDKTPSIKRWKDFQTNKFTDLKAFEGKQVAIITGAISDNLEVFDFDNHGNTAKQILSKYLAIPLVKGIYEKYKLPIIQTQGKGFHLYFRCETIEGSQKLASVLLNGKQDAIIETRGEGGYVLSPLSNGYDLKVNTLKDLQFITSNERTILIEYAKSFNEIVKNTQTYRHKVDDEKPGNIYDALPEAIEETKQILLNSGWKELGFNNGWIRPGKEKGLSATYGNVADNVFYVFTDNSEFENQKAYTPFQIKTILEYNGNFSECAKYLAKKLGLKSNKEEKTDKIPDKNIRKLLIDSLIDLDKKYIEPPIFLGIKDEFKPDIKRIFTPGNISAITGKYKSKKSFFVTMLAAAAVQNYNLFNKIIPHLPDNKRNVLIFDTEQSVYDVYRVANRIKRLTNNNIEHLGVISLRGHDAKEVIEIIKESLNLWPNVGIIFIDQVADLLRSVNAEEEAVEVVKFLEKLTNDNDIHICCVLHENKSNDFAQGWLGTQIMKKSETVINVKKEPNNNSVSYIEPYLLRSMEFERFGIKIENGMPELLNQNELKDYSTEMDLD